MTILSAQARTEAARLRLRKSRRLATGLLFWQRCCLWRQP